MMRQLLDALQTIGAATLDPLWLPLAAWTIVALLVFLALNRWRSGHPFIRYRSAIALLFALPLGVLVAMLAHVLPVRPPADEVVFEGVTPFLLVLPSIPPAEAPEFTLYHALGVFVLLFGAIAIWRLGILAVQYLRLSRFRRRIAADWSSEVQQEVDHLSRALSIRRPVRLVLAPDDVVPMTFGFRRPHILIPRRLLDNEEARRVVLTHELIHVGRHDYLLHAMEELVVALFAWHPLVLLIDRLLHVLREMACDAEVFRREGVTPRRYAELLYSLLPETPPARAFGMAMADTRTMKTRILAMNSFTRFGRVPHFAAALLAILILAGATVAAFRSDALAQPERDMPASLTPEMSVADSSEVFVIVEQMPELIGGLESVQRNLVYPDIALKAGVEGKVFIQFIVDPQGNVVDPVVTRGIGAGCDEAALEAVKQMKFRPGIQRGVPVDVRMSIPITFKLPGSSNQEAVSDGAMQRPTETMNLIRQLRARYENDASLTGDQRRQALQALEELERNVGSAQDASAAGPLGMTHFRISEDGISGRVVDRSGNPVARVNVVVAQTNQGAVTDAEGNFEVRGLTVNPTQVVLHLSHISYSPLTLDLRQMSAMEVPSNFSLRGAHPNPFNPNTTIAFELPAQADVTLEVFDLTGRRVRTQSAPGLSAGVASLRFDGSSLASGVYLYRITAKTADQTESLVGKFTLLK